MALAHEGTILVTGAAGFIGYHLARRLLEDGCSVVGIDNLSPYYDVRLKRARLARLAKWPGFRFTAMDLADRAAVGELFSGARPAAVVNLAAQAGVRYSLHNPHAYIDSNLVGFTNILEGCRHHGVEHLVFASTSSVYGLNTSMPFSVHDNVDHPLSLYAATKKANELMAHSYSHLYRLPVTGLRFFTVYGPWGRPDMALFLFTDAILGGRPIELFNNGNMRRDFTYVDDIVEGIRRVIDHVPAPDPRFDGAMPDPGISSAPYRLFNIGNNRPVELLHLVEVLERALGREAEKLHLPMQAGDVPATCADIADLASVVGFRPDTPIETGVPRFVTWYLEEWLPLRKAGAMPAMATAAAS
ncbi:NAD-dependent epimerase [Geminicoccaceae bacterium 1502E]|nr:NAD-dependent epimerase [Geminicoccaceae bacterium 1502E]